MAKSRPGERSAERQHAAGALRPVTTVAPIASESARGTLFLISQIGPADSDIRKRANVVCDNLVTPVAKDFSLRVIRSDRDPTPGHITTQILRSILDAKVVVADLTGRNPNVYYELAFAQAFGKAVVLLVDDPQTLPFDTQNERTIPIGGGEGPITFEQGTEAQRQLRDALKVVLAGGYVPRSLITETAGARSLEDLAPGDPLASEIGAVREVVEEIRSAVRRQSNAPAAADIRSFSGLIQRLAEEQRLSRSEVESLVQPQTSRGLDNWVSRLVESLPAEKSRDVDPEDIPF